MVDTENTLSMEDVPSNGEPASPRWVPPHLQLRYIFIYVRLLHDYIHTASYMPMHVTYSY